jgi:hypothetical protein
MTFFLEHDPVRDRYRVRHVSGLVCRVAELPEWVSRDTVDDDLCVNLGFEIREPVGAHRWRLDFDPLRLPGGANWRSTTDLSWSRFGN